MIDRETLQYLVLQAGYTLEQADAYCDWYFGPTGYEWCIAQADAALSYMRQLIAQSAETFAEMLDEMADLAYIQLPDKQWPRPPRHAGPQNKGRSWNRQPPRQARSNCRKMRR